MAKTSISKPLAAGFMFALLSVSVFMSSAYAEPPGPAAPSVETTKHASGTLVWYWYFDDQFGTIAEGPYSDTVSFEIAEMINCDNLANNVCVEWSIVGNVATSNCVWYPDDEDFTGFVKDSLSLYQEAAWYCDGGITMTGSASCDVSAWMYVPSANGNISPNDDPVLVCTGNDD